MLVDMIQTMVPTIPASLVDSDENIFFFFENWSTKNFSFLKKKSMHREVAMEMVSCDVLARDMFILLKYFIFLTWSINFFEKNEKMRF